MKRTRAPGFWAVLGAIAALAFVMRAVYALHWAPPLSFLEDDTFFSWSARQIAQGHGYVQPLTALVQKPAPPTAEHPPLYPLLLAAFMKLGLASLGAQRMVNVVLGTVTVVLVACLGRQIAGPRTGLVAAVLCAAYPVFIGADGAIMSETLLGTLVAGSLLVAVRCLQQASLRQVGALGVLIGLAALTRSEAVLLWPLLVLPIALRSPRLPLKVAAVAAAGSFVVIAPWVVRNWVTLGRPVLSDNQGTTVAGANCHSTYYGREIGYFDFACTLKAYRSNRRRESEAVVSYRLQARAVHYAARHPGRALLVAAIRVAGAWGFYAPGRQVVVTGRRRGVQRVGIVMYYALLVLGVIGALRLWRSYRRDVLLVLASPFVVATVTAALTYGFVRIRHAAEVSLVVLAAIGVVSLMEAVRRRTPVTAG